MALVNSGAQHARSTRATRATHTQPMRDRQSTMLCGCTHSIHCRAQGRTCIGERDRTYRARPQEVRRRPLALRSAGHSAQTCRKSHEAWLQTGCTRKTSVSARTHLLASDTRNGMFAARPTGAVGRRGGGEGCVQPRRTQSKSWTQLNSRLLRTVYASQMAPNLPVFVLSWLLSGWNSRPSRR